MTRYIGLCLATALLLAFSACAPKVKTKTLVPARLHEATSLQRIAVLPFSGSHGTQVTQETAAVLSNVRIAGKPYFDVVERQDIKELVKEQALGQTGVIDEATAQETGRMLGAQGVVMGDVSKYYAQDSPYTEMRNICVRYNEKGRCEEYQPRSVPCLRRTAVFSFTPKIVDVRTGRVAASDTFEAMEAASVCRTDGVAMPPGGVLLDNARERALTEFRNAVAPRYVTVVIKLKEDDLDDAPDQTVELLERGVGWAEEGRLDRACGLWREAYDTYPASLAAPYNLGVCAETAGDLEGALDLYKQADQHALEPDDLINQALIRVRQSLANQQRLQNQMQGRQ